VNDEGPGGDARALRRAVEEVAMNTPEYTPAMCRACGEPYVAELRPRLLVEVPAGGPEPTGGRLTVLGGRTYMVGRHRPCPGGRASG
jgi:hypothetical protein